MNLNTYRALSKKYFDESKEFFIKAKLPTGEFDLSKRGTITYLKRQHKFRRIFLGLGIEFLIKSLFIKKGYFIFKVKEPVIINNWKQSWDLKKTIELCTLIDNLDLVLPDLPNYKLKDYKRILHKVRIERNAEIHKFSENIIIAYKDEILLSEAIRSLTSEL